MVFSVQQGEHGPLVVYKLQVPGMAAPTRTQPVPATPAPPAEAAALPRDSLGQLPLRLPTLETIFRVVENGRVGTTMIHEETGDSLTLKQISDEISWRRDTAEKLRQVPIAPRF